VRFSLEQWQRLGARFDFRGHSMFGVDSGEPERATEASDATPDASPEREALLLIHGFPTSSHDWAPLWPALTRRFRCLTLDMLGFGLSAKPWPHAYSIIEQADLFTDFLAAKGIPAAHVLAHDYGVTVAQELVARHNAGGPLQLRSVCLLNGGILPELHRPFRIQRLLASRLGPLIARLTSYRAFAANMRNLWGARPLPDADLRELWSAVSRDRGTRVMPGLIGYMAERRRHRARWVGALEQLDAPLSVIIGMDDPISGAHVAAGCREVFPQAVVVDLPGVGHYPQLEAPAEVLAALPWQLAPA
jgi:pimeloyl-ACP methyl ester carboxylesterase